MRDDAFAVVENMELEVVVKLYIQIGPRPEEHCTLCMYIHLHSQDPSTATCFTLLLDVE